MSLESIRSMRRAGFVPDGPVVVLIGKRPTSVDDSAALVVVDGSPRQDWRPLVGLWVCLVRGDGVDARTVIAVVDALQSVGVKWFGYVDRAEAMPGTVGAGPQHHAALRKTWESLCLC